MGEGLVGKSRVCRGVCMGLGRARLDIHINTRECVSVCSLCKRVCVCVRERESERESLIFYLIFI